MNDLFWSLAGAAAGYPVGLCLYYRYTYGPVKPTTYCEINEDAAAIAILRMTSGLGGDTTKEDE